MNTFECYRMFMALKMHFTTASYDYFKYGGKLKSATPQAFERHKQKYVFQKLQKLKDPEGHIVANLLRNEKAWVGEMIGTEADKCYNEYRKRRDSLVYTVKQELQAVLRSPFDSNLRVADNEHPHLLRAYIRGDISLECLIILDVLCHYIPHWERKLKGDIMWDTIGNRMRKFKPFLPDNVDLEPLRIWLREEYGPES